MQRDHPRGEVILSSKPSRSRRGPAGSLPRGLVPAAMNTAHIRTWGCAGQRPRGEGSDRQILCRLSGLARGAASRDSQRPKVNCAWEGTTHPCWSFDPTGGELDRSSDFFTPRGRAKYYRSSDNVESEAYRGLLPEDLIDILVMHRLDYSHRTSTGVLFHMIGAVSQFGKVGMTAIGDSRQEADQLFDRTVAVLNGNRRERHDEETIRGSRIGRSGSDDRAYATPASRSGQAHRKRNILERASAGP